MDLLSTAPGSVGAIGVRDSARPDQLLEARRCHDVSRGDSLACGEEDQFREATLYSMLSIANSP